MHPPKKFTWLGIDTKGFKVSGEIHASHKEAARSLLLQKKITPLKITREWQLPFFSKNRHIKDADITDFSMEFSTLIASGIPLLQALHILEDNTHKPSMKNMIGSMAKQVESGCLLSVALESYRTQFGVLFCSLIQAGEYAGMLDVVLHQLAQYREKMTALRKKIHKALVYPCIVFSVALSVTAAMLLCVLPQFAQLFQSVGAELPLLTQLLMQSAAQLHTYALPLLCIFFVSFFFLKMGIQRFATWRIFLDRFLLGLPLIGKMIQTAIFARCFRTLSSTLAAGIPLLDALRLTAEVSHNHPYTQAFSAISQHIKSGHTLQFSFQNTQRFSERVIQMIRIGEESGRVEEMLQKLSDYFEAQANHRVENLIQLLEPALMLFLCGMVGTLVIAMYLPIFRIGTAL
jgi:type IV pilus assembly protein PilC